MVYSSCWRKGIGQVKRCFNNIGLNVQDPQFLQHGEHATLPSAPIVLVACSGGRDSLALTALASKVCASRGIQCAAIIVNHNLQKDSRKVALNAAKTVAKLGVDESLVFIKSVQVKDNEKGEESAARDARYAAIIEVAKDLRASAVLLAHTANDQAETVLMGLRDSAGLEAVAGMKDVAVKENVLFARPLINLTRLETTQICKDLGVEWWDDPTNGDSSPIDVELPKAYPLRSRIRHTLMPYISRFFESDMTLLLAKGAKFAQDDLDYINSQVNLVEKEAIVKEDCKVKIKLATLENSHISIRRRIVARALSAAGIRFSSNHIESIDELITNWHGQKPIALPGGYAASRKSHTITIYARFERA